MILDYPKYVISLPQRMDRWQSFQSQALSIGIKDYVKFEAFKGTGKKSAQRACKQSHKAVIGMASYNNYEAVVIFEDDVLISPDILFRLSQWDSQIPEEWDMIYLGAHNHKPLIMISENLGRCSYSLSTVGYVVRNTLYKAITGHLEEDLPLDMIYVRRIQPRFKCFCFKPNLVTQLKGYSDIENRVVDYSKYYIC